MEGIVSNNVSFILVFIEGIISFFSPCVIPLIPVYMSYLAGNAKKEEDGKMIYDSKLVFFNTLFFVLGISFAFFILAMSFTLFGKFFNQNKMLFTRIGGIFIILLGLFQFGIFNVSFLQRERKIHINLENKSVNPFIALLLGFTFSFAWTPCIGPALSSVLIMASGAKTAISGYLLVLVYAAGFVIPFLLLGLFTTEMMQFIKNNQKFLKYSIKVGAIILIIMGIMIFTGWMNSISSYMNSIGNNKSSNSQIIGDNESAFDTDKNNGVQNNSNANSKSQTEENKQTNSDTKPIIPAFDFTLTDQYGKKHTLSDYKGKVVFLNFWATWCPPCKKEIPDIEDLYKEYNLNQEEVVFLGVTNPKSEKYPNNQDDEKEKIISFLEKNGYTFPTLFDETGEVLQNYNISAFPTTFMIDKEGNIFGYVPGMMTKDIMVNIINQTLKSNEETIK